MTQHDINRKADAYISGGMAALKAVGMEQETARKLAEAQSALAELMEYTIDMAANLLGSQDYFNFFKHPTVKAAQEIIAQNSARG